LLFVLHEASLASAKRNSRAIFGGNAIFVLFKFLVLLMETASAILMINNK
jgi:hypothetical protein